MSAHPRPRLAIGFAAASAIAIGATYVFPPEDPHYAPYMLGYNLTIFFPLLTLSCICAFVAWIFALPIRRSPTTTFRSSIVALVLTLPCLLNVLSSVIVLLIIFL